MRTEEEVKAMSREELEVWALTLQSNEQLWYDKAQKAESKLNNIIRILHSLGELGIGK